MEPLDLVRRLIMTGTLALLPHAGFRTFIGCVLAFACLAIHCLVQPYSSATLNTLATFAHCVIVSVFLAGLVIQSQLFGYTPWKLGFVLLLMSLLVLVVAVALRIGELRQELEAKKKQTAASGGARVAPDAAGDEYAETTTAQKQLCRDQSSRGNLPVAHAKDDGGWVCVSCALPNPADLLTCERCEAPVPGRGTILPGSVKPAAPEPSGEKVTDEHGRRTRRRPQKQAMQHAKPIAPKAASLVEHDEEMVASARVQPAAAMAQRDRNNADSQTGADADPALDEATGPLEA